MIKRYRIVILCFMAAWTNVFSQQLSHQVLVPLAGVASDDQISYSQTVGETAVEVVGCTEYLFTQGFQQPRMKRVEIKQPEGSGIKVYPNPVSDYVVVELYGEKEKAFSIEIINIMGKVIRTDRRVFYDQFWYREPQNVGDLIRGFYLIRVTSDDGMINRTFKIEKI